MIHLDATQKQQARTMKTLFIIPLLVTLTISQMHAQNYQVYKRPAARLCHTTSRLNLPTNASHRQTFEVKVQSRIPSVLSQAVLYIEGRRIGPQTVAPFKWVVDPRQFRLSSGRQRVQVKMISQCGRKYLLTGEFDLD